MLEMMSKFKLFCLISIVFLLVAAGDALADSPRALRDDPQYIKIRGDSSREWDKEEVLATVGDKVFTKKSIQWRIDGLPSEQQKKYQSDEQKRTILENLIQNHLLALEAKERKYDKEKGVAAALEDLIEYHLAQVYIRYQLSDISVSDEEAKKYYEENKEKFKTPAMLRAQHILVSVSANSSLREEKEALKKINKIKKDLDKGADFSALAEKSSDDAETKSKGGDVGYFTRENTNPDFADAAFGLKKGEVSKPVRSVLGYHLIKLTDRKDEAYQPFEQVVRNVKMTIFELKRQEVIKDTIRQLKEKYKVVYAQ